MNIGTWLNDIHCCEPTGQTAWLGPIFPAVIHWTMVSVGKGPEEAPDGSLMYQSFMFHAVAHWARGGICSEQRNPRKPERSYERVKGVPDAEQTELQPVAAWHSMCLDRQHEIPGAARFGCDARFGVGRHVPGGGRLQPREND